MVDPANHHPTSSLEAVSLLPQMCSYRKSGPVLEGVAKPKIHNLDAFPFIQKPWSRGNWGENAKTPRLTSTHMLILVAGFNMFLLHKNFVA